MGIPWLFEGIHYVSHEHHYKTEPSTRGPAAYDFENTHSGFTDVFYRIVDVFNLLRGLFIFIIFVCKKTIWEKMKKIPWINKVEKRFPRSRSLSIMSRASRTLSFGSQTETVSIHSAVETPGSNRMSSAWKRVSNITSVSFRNIKRKADEDSNKRKMENDGNNKIGDFSSAKDTVKEGNEARSKHTLSLPLEEIHTSLKNTLSLPLEQKGKDNLAETIDF